MSFVAWHDEVQALSSYRSHQSFTVGIRLRCPDRRTQYSQSEGVLYFCVQLRRKDRIAVVDEELTGMIARDGVPQLLECPFRRGMSRHIAKQNAAASDLQDQEHEQNPETRDHRHEKIAGHDARSMIADKGLPRWRRSSPASAAVPGGCGQYLRTVRGETSIPSFKQSSSAMRSSPQVTFSLTIRAMSWRICFGSGGRPPRDFQRQ